MQFDPNDLTERMCQGQPDPWDQLVEARAATSAQPRSRDADTWLPSEKRIATVHPDAAACEGLAVAVSGIVGPLGEYGLPVALGIDPQGVIRRGTTVPGT